MERTKIILENGQALVAGPQDPSLVSVELTRSVNPGEELEFGGVCAAMARMVLTVEDTCPIGYGDIFTLYKGETRVGIFQAEKPKWSSAHRVQITAYDPVIRLEKEISSFLKTLDPWPATLRELAQAVCEECGIGLQEDPFPNEDYPARPFQASSVTGRKVMSWIAQAAGRFCTANEEGALAFGWYRQAEDVAIAPQEGDDLQATLHQGDLKIEGITASLEGQELKLEGISKTETDGEGNLVLMGDRRIFFYQGSLQLADYQTAPIEKVQIRQDSNDVGVMYPDVGPANTYVISGNPLLTAETPEDLLPIAEGIYEQIKTLSYTPCTVTVDASSGLRPGDIVTLTDGTGRSVQVLFMESCQKGTKETFSSTGSANRECVSAVHNSSWQALSGKILRLQTDVEGLQVANADAAGNSAALSLTVSGIENKVTGYTTELETMKTQMTLLQQEKDRLELKIQTMEEEGVRQVVTETGYRFSADGLQISKTGMEMENRIDHTGMHVTRSGQQILQADNQGVVARDVTVKNYLVMGEHARFEDYGTGTACFYIG